MLHTKVQRASTQKLRSAGQAVDLHVATVVSAPPPTRHARSGSAKVKTIQLPGTHFKGFHDEFKQFIVEHQLDKNWTANDEEGAQRYISAAFTHTMRWLPPSLVYDLHRFFYDPSSPSALYIQGLPTDPEVPPTPVGSDMASIPETRVPVTEALTMGIAKCLGDPFTFGRAKKWNRGGLLFDLTPMPNESYKHKVPLVFHQDYIMMSVDCLILSGVRKDPSGQAYTYICDNRTLAAAMDPKDLALLRSNKVTMKTAGGEVYKALGATEWWWYAADGPEEDPVFRLWEPVVFDQAGGLAVGGVSPEVTAAYQRAMSLAGKVADPVIISPGDVLIINNQRATHARATFPAKMDGSDRWLLRVMGVAQPGRLYRNPIKTMGAEANTLPDLNWPELALP